MMYWDDGGWGWVAWLTMTVFMVGFWGLVAWVIVTLARGPASGRDQHRDRSADDILAERFARGEIDKDEYTQRRDTLRSVR